MVAELPPVSLRCPLRDDASVNSHDEPRALGGEDEEGHNIRRILHIRRLIVPRKKPHKESTSPGDDAGDSHTAVEIVDGPNDDRQRSHSRKNPFQSKVCNCSDCIPRLAEIWDRP